MSTPDPRTVERRSALLLWLCAFCVLGFLTWERDLFDADEGRYATVAKNMWATGDWVVPRLDDMPFMDKPPLVYWVQATCYTVFGPSAFFARLPTVLAGSVWCLLLFLFARRLTRNEGVAWIVGLLAATSAAGCVGSRVGPQMDMPLAAAVAGALYAAYAGLTNMARGATGRPGVGPTVGLGVAVGLGLLIKGPLVVAVPFLVAVAWTLAGIPWRATARVALSPTAWGVALLIAAPWYVLVERAMPGWIEHFITYEHFGRFSRGDHRNFHPFWFYVPIVLIYLAPWTPLAWGARSARERKHWWGRPLSLATASPWSVRPWDDALAEPDLHGVRAGRVLYLWFIVAFALYSVSTRKLLNYLLPAAGPLFILAGARLHALLETPSRRPWLMPLLMGTGAMLLGLFVHLRLWLPLATGRLPSAVDAPRWNGMGPLLTLAGALLVGGAFLSWRRRTAGRVACLSVLIGGAALFWIAVDAAMGHVDHLGSARGVAQAIERATADGTPVIAYKRYPQGTGFYSDRAVWIAGDVDGDFLQREIVQPYAELARRDGLERNETGLPVWTGVGNVLTTAEMERLWRGARRVLLLCRWGEVAAFGGRIVGGPYAGAGRTDLFLLENRPR